MDDWALVVELCYMFDLDPTGLMEEALKRAISPREIIAGFARTFAYMRIHGLEATSNAPLAELDAMPPGTLDTRIVYNDVIWIDIFRRSHAISTMSAQHVSAVIALLHRRAPELYDLGSDGGDIHAWLETTPLIHALRHRLEALDEADDAEDAAGEWSPFDIFGDAETGDLDDEEDHPTAASASTAATRAHPTGPDGVDFSRLPNDSAWRAILGPVWTVRSLSYVLGKPIAEIEHDADSLRLLRIISTEGESLFPAFQFTKPEVVMGLTEVLQTLREGVDDPITWAQWLATPTGNPPTRNIDRLAVGGLKAVILDAERTAASWRS